MLQGNFKSSFRDQSFFKTVLNIVLGITSPMLVLHGAVLAYSGRENLGKGDTFTDSDNTLFGWDCLYLAGMPIRVGRHLPFPNLWFIPQ